MLIAESSSSSYPYVDETSTATITNNATTLAANSAKKSKLSLSTSSFSSSLSLSQTQKQAQQQRRSQSLPAGDRSIAATTISSSLNVFTNFPPSCCCRQMMMITKTPPTVTPTTTVGNNCKTKSLKNGSDSRLVGNGGSGGNSSNIGGPSPFRQLLPIALCILSFATVLSILIVYMDTTEIRHQQFRLNMSRDYELHGVSQDNPTLIAFLREIHMKKYPMNFLKNARVEHLNFSEHHELTPEMAHYISNLVGGKLNGAFIQSITGATSNTMTGPWLAETLNWSGLLIEPEPRRYFTLRKQNVHRPKVQVVHACVSPSGYPKEVRIHNEDSEVRINSLLDEETSWFNTRVKCFPLYTLMLAINKVDYDLLSLGCAEHELQILQTLPFDKVNIEVISIHLTDNNNNSENVNRYVRNITKFLLGKSYKLQKRFENNYIYQKINSNKTKTYNQFRKISSTISSVTTPISTTTKMTELAKLQQRQQYNKNFKK